MSDLDLGGAKLLDPDNILNNILKVGFKSQVADLGCGTMGNFSLASARLVGSDGEVYAVDVLKDVLSAVEERARTAKYSCLHTVWSNVEVYGATKIPGEMDFAYLVAVLYQNKDHLSVLKEAARLLKVGGKLLIIEWVPKATPIGPAVEKRLSPETVKGLAQQISLKFVQEFSAGPYHYGLIFQK
ncbi:MAG: hypothetical protein COX77_03320 [Candidatus Komeilibacteria bacterium CG_4_10_14_0_2_um_filter_37_10]|uniref:Uncharacterized protein n=1 Tax=Candidatus Komeilibacteria bacterium CG_4_10_14_0_2_um_filter_37_10 TaxID=1974470 RepID=A0A2M7VEA2_9BACT|nr:MAG: hypothetical protein COX77_03320 [Candidatus Komeilibacteria bacterium CG_4_10_14_0_2_um_filter_37_10]PJA92960.1 MAG: hypothetical protein CO133_01475 [Candidatus Komeilibacteria bacterium CG_4_9_14_3_um_filter_37_5]